MKTHRGCTFKAIMAILFLPSTLIADQLKDMTEALTVNSPAAFLSAIESNRWSPPLIHSKWYVDMMADQSARHREVQARDFGKLMAERLDGWSNDLRNSKTSDEIAHLVKNLIDLSDWIATANGYGNLLLAFRCDDVASVGLGKLAIDLEFPFAVVHGLVARLQAPWQSALPRAQMLNDEAGSAYFDITGNDAATIQDLLVETWQDAQSNVRAQEIRQQSPRLIEPAVGAAYFDGEDPSINAMREALDSHPPLPADQMAFFTDTPTASYPERPWSTVRLWDIKRHSFFVGGDLESPNLRKLNALLMFREHVGSFPERLALTDEQVASQEAEIADAAKRGIQIVPADKAYGSARKAAFSFAWRKVSVSEPAIGRLACDAYEAVISSDFVDADAHEERLAAQIKAVVPEAIP